MADTPPEPTVKYEVLNDPLLGIGQRIYLYGQPNEPKKFFEEYRVPYLKLENGEYISAKQFPAPAFIRIFSDNWKKSKGVISFPNLGKTGIFAYLAKQRNAMFASNTSWMDSERCNGNRNLDGLASWENPFFGKTTYLRDEFGTTQNEIDSSELRNSLNDFATRYVQFLKKKNEDSTFIYFIGGFAGVIAGFLGLAIQLVVKGKDSGRPGLEFLTIPAGGGVGIGIAQLVNGITDRGYRQMPKIIAKALYNGTNNTETLEQIAGFLADAEKKMHEARKENENLKVDPNAQSEILDTVIKQKNELRDKEGQNEMALRVGAYNLEELLKAPSLQRGLSFTYEAPHYEVLKKLLTMTLGYEQPIKVESKEQFIRHVIGYVPRVDEPIPDIKEALKLEATVEKCASEDVKYAAKKVIANQYELEEAIGRGGMGIWYKAKDKKNDQIVAIKLPLHSEGAKAIANHPFKKVAGLQNEGVIKILDYYRGDEPYIIAEYFPSLNLRELMRATKLPVQAWTELVYQAAKAVEAAHEEGILHNDLKPENILVGTDGKVKVGDFDFATTITDVLRSTIMLSGEHTKEGVAGTHNYIAPERMLGSDSTERSDVYSLGKIMYELATGDLTVDPRPIRSRNKEVSSQLEDAINMALISEPKLRMQSVKALREALERCERQPVLVQVTYKQPVVVAEPEVHKVPASAVPIIEQNPVEKPSSEPPKREPPKKMPMKQEPPDELLLEE